jgi:TolB-like protein/Flp pilus assembly protein TadD
VAALGGMGPSLAQAGPLRRWNLRRNWLALAGVAATLLLGAGLWTAFRSAPAPQGPALVPGLSIVVLPFTNLSGDATQDYLADVITDGLTTGLSRIRGSFVIARSTAFTYKGKPIDVKQIGRELGVRYVLEGSEQQGGDRVRVNAQLISAETGAHLWADQFDTGRADLLTLQDEIVTRLARALEIETVAVEAAHRARARAGNQDAEDLTLRCWAGSNSPVGSAELDTAFDLCERALNIDGGNVLARSIIAWKYLGRMANGLSTDPQADIRKAEDLIDQVLARDPDDYGAHLAKSMILTRQRRSEEALVEAERSLALNPSYVPAYTGLWFANFYVGRPEKVIEICDRAIRLSPRDPVIYGFYFGKGAAYAMLNDGAQALEWFRRAVALAPQFPNAQLALAIRLALNGQEAEAHDVLQRYLVLKATRIRTIAQYRTSTATLSDNSAYLASVNRAVEGLRKAGMPEE